MGRDQGHCWTSYSTQDCPPLQRIILKLPVVPRWRNPELHKSPALSCGLYYVPSGSCCDVCSALCDQMLKITGLGSPEEEAVTPRAGPASSEWVMTNQHLSVFDGPLVLYVPVPLDSSKVAVKSIMLSLWTSWTLTGYMAVQSGRFIIGWITIKLAKYRIADPSHLRGRPPMLCHGLCPQPHPVGHFYQWLEWGHRKYYHEIPRVTTLRKMLICWWAEMQFKQTAMGLR